MMLSAARCQIDDVRKPRRPIRSHFGSRGPSSRRLCGGARSHSVAAQLRGMPGEAADRKRYAGSAEELAEVLFPLVATKRFIMYDDAAKVSDSKTMPELINKSHELLAGLHDADSKLAFCRSTVKAALEIVLEKRSFFDMSEDHRKPWLETNTCRVMNLCRCVSQGDLKATRPAWANQLPWNNDGDEPPTKKSKKSLAAEAKPSTSEWKFGWCPVVRKAWRQPQHAKGGKLKDFTEPVVPENAKPSDPPIATWADGMTVEITDLCCDDLSTMNVARAGSKQSVDIFFSGEHKRTHHKVIVRERHDRAHLVSLFEQTRQRCQVRVDAFDSMKDAADLMVKVAKAFVNDEVPVEQLKQYRNKLLLASGMSVPQSRKKRGAKKKPAASESDVPKKSATAKKVQKAEKKPDAASTKKKKRKVAKKKNAAPKKVPEQPATTAGNDKEVKKKRTKKNTAAQKDVPKKAATTAGNDKRVKKKVAEHSPAKKPKKIDAVEFPDFCDFEFNKFSKAVRGFIEDDVDM